MEPAHQRQLLAHLRQKSSEEAANWLMEHYTLESGLSSEAIRLISHRSWKKVDQIRLADYYLQKAPFAHSYPYEVFASIMSTTTLVHSLGRHIPADPARRSLLAYFLNPLLRSCVRSNAEEEIVGKFLEQLGA